jgi:hypothetical protein
MVETVIVPGPPPPAGPGGLPVPVPSASARAAFATVAQAAAEALEAVAHDLAAHLVEMSRLTVATLEEFGEGGTQIGLRLQDVATGDLSGLAELIGLDLVPGLGDALSELLEEAVGEMNGHLEQLGEVVGAGAGTVGLFAALAPPLECAHGVVETIHHLLEAMALGL